MTTDEQAKKLGRALGLQVMQATEQQTATKLSYGTVQAVHSDSTGITVDVNLNGGTLYSIPCTTACSAVRPDDRVLLETFGKLTTATGIIARQTARQQMGGGTVNAPLFEWTSTFAGTPSQNYLEATNSITHSGGPLFLETAAAIGGTGEYGVGFEFLQNGSRVAYWDATSPQKNGGTLRWTAVGTVWLPAGTYSLKLWTTCWGTVTLVNTDSSGTSLKWRDSRFGTSGVSRYARIY